MSFLTKAARPNLAAIHPFKFKHNTFISRAAISTISDVIKKDHQEIKEYADNIRTATDDDSKTRWQNQFTWELTRHSIGEELVVYPAFAKHLGPKGQAMADKDRDEHQSVKDSLYKFQNLTPDNPEFLSTLDVLMKDLNQHIKEEENDDLPALESAIESNESESIAKSFGRTKAFVPSRSHPSAPNKPPFETVVGLMAAPIDHLGDLFRKFPDKTISPNPSTK
ncbi:putative hemerythrin-like protein [Lachnellula occidentalis]|uniref:Putative hemerythrin-like protein n=1 Tax=Lachnellula occidentalis TaxID=215460 RepID=A0A8H8S708_9HELO|nr:putative hemerythrin-like protein [Lachnellula occidentalis]